MNDLTWHYKTTDDQSVGPLTTEALKALIATAALPIEIPVMASGSDQWVAARMFPEFRNVAPAEATYEAPRPVLWNKASLDEGLRPEFHDDEFEPHPRLRFFARAIDRALFLVPCVLLFILFATPHVRPASVLLALLGYHVVWAFVEAWMLSAYGATPGKSALGISVETSSGRFPTFRQALIRSALVQITGEGLGLPLVSLIAMLVSYQTLIERRRSNWDKATGLRVRHAECPALRVCGVLFLTWLLVCTMGIIFCETIRLTENGRHSIFAKRTPWVPPPHFAIHSTVMQEGYPVDLYDGVDPRQKAILGEWRRPENPSKPCNLEVLVFKNDKTFSGHFCRADKTGKIIPGSDLPGEWSGEWRIYGRDLILIFTASTSTPRPIGVCKFELSQISQYSFDTMPGRRLTAGFDPGPRQSFWRYVKHDLIVAQTE